MNIEIDCEEKIMEVLKASGTYITDEQIEYFFLPYWFEVADKKLIMHKLGNLPKPLSVIIELLREEII